MLELLIVRVLLLGRLGRLGPEKGGQGRLVLRFGRCHDSLSVMRLRSPEHRVLRRRAVWGNRTCLTGKAISRATTINLEQGTGMVVDYSKRSKDDTRMVEAMSPAAVLFHRYHRCACWALGRASSFLLGDWRAGAGGRFERS
jgi:hypothetical protein